MNDVFSFAEGSTPLLVSVPHDGRSLPDDIRQRMTPAGLDIPDTDWHVAEFYDFVTDWLLVHLLCEDMRIKPYVANLDAAQVAAAVA